MKFSCLVYSGVERGGVKEGRKKEKEREREEKKEGWRGEVRKISVYCCVLNHINRVSFHVYTL